MQTFVYGRVSTAAQTSENQLVEIERAGYLADSVYQEQVSGKVPARERPEFAKLLDAIARTRRPKRLIVTKLDRLGRDALDIMGVVRALGDMDCAVRVLQLGDLDLTSSAGKLVLSTLSAVAELERDLLVERTLAGIERARKQGKTIGRPRATDDATASNIRKRLSDGISVSQLARDHGVSRATIIRIRDAGAGAHA